jgi:hypothetical protein
MYDKVEDVITGYSQTSGSIIHRKCRRGHRAVEVNLSQRAVDARFGKKPENIGDVTDVMVEAYLVQVVEMELCMKGV